MMNLEEIRQKIDNVDDQIIELLIKRYDLVLDVKSYKSQNQLPVLDQSREQKIYQKIIQKKYPEQLKEIYTIIMSLSKTMQRS